MTGSLIFGFLLLLCGVVAYFLPALIADRRGRDGAGMIAILNLFLGWTVLGWLVLLIVAFTGRSRREREQHDEHLALMRAMVNAQQAGGVQVAAPLAAPPTDAADVENRPGPESAQPQTMDAKVGALLDSVSKRYGIDPHTAVVATIWLTVITVGAVLALAKLA